MPTREDANRLDPEALRAPILRVLRPLVSLMIRAGISFPTFVDLVRCLYVQTAEREFSLSGRTMTDSRISLITGVHRKEVRRLRDAPIERETVSSHLSLTGRLMTRWLGSPAFTGPDGRPLHLPRVADAGQPSFDALVMLETRDVHPRSILDEWITRGLASVAQDGRVVLEVAALVPQAGGTEQLHFFGRNLHDHVAAAVANVVGPRPVFLDRSVHYDRLSMAAAQRLAEVSRTLAVAALNDANRQAQAERDASEDGAWRWNFGLYVYLEEAEPAAMAQNEARTAE